MATNFQPLDPEVIRSHRCGVIEMKDGQFYALHFRRWPKLVTVLDVMWRGPRYHHHTPGNHCLLYYHQPYRFPNFLALTYALSTKHCTLATFRGSLNVLDRIAEIKRADALLCDAWNSRISDRLLARWGWEPHAPSRWHRNYIKRFYGVYPQANDTASTAAIDLVTPWGPR
jgi:hypothetical protein